MKKITESGKGYKDEGKFGINNVKQTRNMIKSEQSLQKNLT